MQEKRRRNSSIELLRILCILGIACMHALGPVFSNPRFVPLSLVTDGLFQIGVTCFILISGYYGVKWSFQKFLHLNLLAVYACALETLLKYRAMEAIYAKDLIKNLLITAFPVFTNRFWFLSCYVCVMMLAPFLEIMTEHLSKKQFLALVSVLLFLFYCCPTFLLYQIIGGDGKNLVNFLTVYLLGRYLRIALPARKGSRKRRIFIKAGVAAMMFAATVVLNICFMKVMRKIEFHFSTDSSIFILIEAISVFLLFQEFDFYAKPINQIAGFVLPVYLYHSTLGLTYLLPQLTEEYLTARGGFAGMAVTIVGTVFASVLISVLVELVRRVLFTGAEKKLFPILEKNAILALDWCEKCLTPYGGG